MASSCKYVYCGGPFKGQACGRPIYRGEYCDTCLRRNNVVITGNDKYPGTVQELLSKFTIHGALPGDMVNLLQYLHPAPPFHLWIFERGAFRLQSLKDFESMIGFTIDMETIQIECEDLLVGSVFRYTLKSIDNTRTAELFLNTRTSSVYSASEEIRLAATGWTPIFGAPPS